MADTLLSRGEYWRLDILGDRDRVPNVCIIDPSTGLPAVWRGSSSSPDQVQIRDENGALVSYSSASPVYQAPAGTPWKYVAAASGIAASTTAVPIAAAAGASLRNYISWFSLQTATLGNATEFCIRDGAAGTVIFRTQLQTTAMPLVHVNVQGTLFSTANTLLEVVTLSSATGGVYFNCGGFIAA